MNIHNTQKRVVSNLEIVTPHAARKLRDSAHFERQRNLSQEQIKKLANEMAAGRFIPGMQIYLAVMPAGQQFILNGNHTLEAVALYGKPVALTVTRVFINDFEEAGRIYAVFDTQKLRSWRDSLRATGASESLPHAEKVLSAIGVIDRKFGQAGESLGRLGRLDRLVEYQEPAELFHVAMRGANRANQNLLLRAAVLAVALETLRYQPSTAAEFWLRIANDDGLSAGMPEKALLNWLRNYHPKPGSAGQKDMTRAAAIAWNASWKNEARQLIKPGAMTSFYLLGTPWSNGPSGVE